MSPSLAEKGFISAAVLTIAGVLTFGYTVGRTVHSRVMQSSVEERAQGLNHLANLSRTRAQRIQQGRARGNDPALTAQDPDLAQAFNALGDAYARDAARVRSGAEQAHQEVRSRAAPTVRGFIVGNTTGIPYDDIVFIGADFQNAYGQPSPNVDAERQRAAPQNHPSDIRSRILSIAAGAHLRTAYQQIAAEDPQFRGMDFDDPRVITLVRNRAQSNIRNTYSTVGANEHLQHLDNLMAALQFADELSAGFTDAVCQECGQVSIGFLALALTELEQNEEAVLPSMEAGSWCQNPEECVGGIAQSACQQFFQIDQENCKNLLIERIRKCTLLIEKFPEAAQACGEKIQKEGL